MIDPVDSGRMYDWNEKGIVKHDSGKQTQEVLIPTSRLVPWTNYTVHVQAQNAIGLSGRLFFMAVLRLPTIQLRRHGTI